MTTIYLDDLFQKSTLTSIDGSHTIVCTLKSQDGRYIADLLRSDSKGECTGRMVEPSTIPDWMVPGTILKGVVSGLKMVLTVEPVLQSRVEGVVELLGAKLKFSYVVVAEFND